MLKNTEKSCKIITECLDLVSAGYTWELSFTRSALKKNMWINMEEFTRYYI